jgi:hypothetical protein
MAKILGRFEFEYVHENIKIHEDKSSCFADLNIKEGVLVGNPLNHYFYGGIYHYDENNMRFLYNKLQCSYVRFRCTDIPKINVSLSSSIKMIKTYGLWSLLS